MTRNLSTIFFGLDKIVYFLERFIFGYAFNMIVERTMILTLPQLLDSGIDLISPCWKLKVFQYILGQDVAKIPPSIDYAFGEVGDSLYYFLGLYLSLQLHGIKSVHKELNEYLNHTENIL